MTRQEILNDRATPFVALKIMRLLDCGDPIDSVDILRVLYGMYSDEMETLLEGYRAEIQEQEDRILAGAAL